MSALKSLVLVGPTNVGKSTLFNRLTRTRKAIVCDRPGVTVDRHEWKLEESPLGPSTPIKIVDTGGVGPMAREHPLGPEIERSAAIAVKTADLILFVVDGTRETGLEELEVASWLRKQNIPETVPVWVIANKQDSRSFDLSSSYNLGFDRVMGLSAEHNEGVDDLWQALKEHFGEGLDSPVSSEQVDDVGLAAPAKIIVVGRPNVGKSTLLNSLLGEDRHVVSPVSGTTRDVITSELRRGSIVWQLADTAGLRRPGRLERGVEWVAREKLKEALQQADVAVVVVDSQEGVTDIDAATAGMAIDMGVGVVLAFNKWDLMRGKDDEHQRDLLYKLERSKDLKVDFLEWCPQVQLSGLSGKGIAQLTKAVEKVLEARRFRVKTSELNTLFEKRLRTHPHPAGKGGKNAKFYYLSQVGVAPPQFVLFSNLASNDVHFSYRRYSSNTLRSEFGFSGAPIKLYFKTAR